MINKMYKTSTKENMGGREGILRPKTHLVLENRATAESHSCKKHRNKLVQWNKLRNLHSSHLGKVDKQS